jgi:hypothetical protein
MPVFQDHTLEFSCPRCQRRHSKSVSWIRANSLFSCVCGYQTAINGRQLDRSARGIERQMDRLNRELKRLGQQPITIRIA